MGKTVCEEEKKVMVYSNNNNKKQRRVKRQKEHRHTSHTHEYIEAQWLSPRKQTPDVLITTSLISSTASEPNISDFSNIVRMD